MTIIVVSVQGRTSLAGGFLLILRDTANSYVISWLTQKTQQFGPVWAFNRSTRVLFKDNSTKSQYSSWFINLSLFFPRSMEFSCSFMMGMQIFSPLAVVAFLQSGIESAAEKLSVKNIVKIILREFSLGTKIFWAFRENLNLITYVSW